jgi:hypothetical protein
LLRAQRNLITFSSRLERRNQTTVAYSADRGLKVHQGKLKSHVMKKLKIFNLDHVTAITSGDHATLLETKNGSNVMEIQTKRLDETEDEIFTCEVSDEVLEITGGEAKERVNFTLGACTGLSVCPG